MYKQVWLDRSNSPRGGLACRVDGLKRVDGLETCDVNQHELTGRNGSKWVEILTYSWNFSYFRSICLVSTVMSLSRRQTSRTTKPPPMPPQLTEAEMDENGFLGDGSEPPIPFPPPRTPLHSIPDPSQNPSEGDPTKELGNSSPVVHNLGSPKLVLGNTWSAQVTPSRSTPRTSWRNGDRPPRRSSVCRSLREVVGDVRSGSEVKPIDFELEEDPTFWRDQNVKVLIRILPINSDRSTLEEYGRCVRQESSRTLIWTGHPEARFTFDNVACETTSQEKFFKAVGLPMVENCLSGYNSCMFAYGQTGSGKTYTMMGDLRVGDITKSEARGMTPRIFECLFTRIREEENNRRDDKLKYSCKCSFLEIYNEQITDLLDPSSTNLQLREDVKKGVYVENLREYEVNSVEDAAELLLQGSANRKVAVTNMNSESSRSHSLFTCTIESKWERDGMKHLRFSRLNLVDLAGSERQKSSCAEGERLKEAANINKSLSTLSLVIMTLVDVASGKHRHVPYRDSKLTFLLQDSLGGNSKTIIIANVNPSVCSANETLSTLKFAQRAKLIQNNAKVNEDASGDEVALQRQIQKLKDEVSFLMKHQNDHRCDECSARSSEIAGVENVQLDCDMNSLQNSVYKLKVKNVDLALVGALRREKMAEDAIQRLETEIKHLRRLLSEREDDALRTKEIIRLREDKINRLELLVDGLISAEDHLAAENDALSEEIQLLRTKIDRNPELTHFTLENVRLLDQIRKYQEFYEKGERETMLSENIELRNQFLNAFGTDEREAGFSSLKLNEDAREMELNQDPIRGFQGRTHIKDEIATNIEVDSAERVKPTAVSISSLHSKLESMNKEIKDARILNRQLQYHELPELSLQHEINKSRKHFKGESIKLLISLQEELFKLQQEISLKDENHDSFTGSFQAEREDLLGKIYSVTQENTKFVELISAKEAENNAIAEDWEKAIVYLTSFLVDGHQSLHDASQQIETIINSFPHHNTCVTEHIKRGLNVFLDKETLIHNLQNKLADAQQIGLEMMAKMESLKGATFVMTGVEHAQEDEVIYAPLVSEGLQSERIPMTHELKNLLKYKDNGTSEVGKKATGLSVKRLGEMGCGQIFSETDEELMGKGRADISKSLYQYSKLRAIGTLTTKLGRSLSALRARIEEHHCFSGKSIEMKSQVTSQVRQDSNERDNGNTRELNDAINVLLINDIGSICHSLKEVQDHITELVDHCLTSDISYSGGNCLCLSTDFQSQTHSVDSDCDHRSGYVVNLDVQPADSLLLKFQEAEETMKEADVIMNALLELNESTRNEKNMWKQASEALIEEKSVLLAELEVLKASNLACKQQFRMSGNQLNRYLIEIIGTLSSFKGFLNQVQEMITEELKVAYLDILSFGEDLFQFIGTSRSCVEDMLCELMEKEFTVFALNQCYLGAFTERNRNFDLDGRERKLLESTLVGGKKDLLQDKDSILTFVEDNLDKVQEWKQMHDKLSLKNLQIVDLSSEAGDAIDENAKTCVFETKTLECSVGSHLKFGKIQDITDDRESSGSWLKDYRVAAKSPLLRKEVSRNDSLLQGLCVDFMPLQQFTSSFKNIKIETEELVSVLGQVQCDLAAKTAEIEEIMIQKQEVESKLADCEVAFNNSSADLKQAREKLALLFNENTELKSLLEDAYSKKIEAELVIQNKDKVIDGLEREILYVNSSLEDKILSSIEDIEEELEQVTDERDCLREEVIYLNDKLEMASALADENEAIAVEVRQDFEACKVYAQQKDAEVKILESSVEELEETIDFLERKVHSMVDEVEGHPIIRGELEQELQELKQRILIIETATEGIDITESGAGKDIQISRLNDDVVTELRNARNYIRHLEEEKGKKAKEIEKYRKHIAELVMHSEKQSALYQQKFKLLEQMIHEATDTPQNNAQTTLAVNKMERGSSRTRGSGSPFKCISNIIQQMNIEKDQELSVAHIQIEELESLAANRQKEVCKLNARLEAVNHMTHDVVRDLLEVKLDMTNYSNLIDQNELQNLLENAQYLNETINAKEQEILGLRRDIESLLGERDSWIEEANQLKEEILATKVAGERFHQQDQLLKAQNEMLKVDKANLTQRIAELDLTITKLVGSQSIQELIQQSDNVMENSLSKVDGEGFIRRLAKTDQLLNLAKNERATVYKQKAKHWKEQRFSSGDEGKQ